MRRFVLTILFALAMHVPVAAEENKLQKAVEAYKVQQAVVNVAVSELKAVMDNPSRSWEFNDVFLKYQKEDNRLLTALIELVVLANDITGASPEQKKEAHRLILLQDKTSAQKKIIDAAEKLWREILVPVAPKIFDLPEFERPSPQKPPARPKLKPQIVERG